MLFNYEKLLRDNQIDPSSLPAPIQQAILELEALEFDLSAETDDDEIRSLRTELKKLDREIYDLIVDELDEESDEDLPPQEIKINLIHTIWQAGLRIVKLSELKKHGYPIPTGSKWKETVGDYSLKKNLYEETVHISKS